MRWLYVAIPLLAMLGGAVWFMVYSWNALGGDPIPGYGYAALAGGIFFSLLVGCGLMALVFYSNRHGYDDAAASDQSEKPD
jgi:hypothetical protein